MNVQLGKERHLLQRSHAVLVRPLTWQSARKREMRIAADEYNTTDISLLDKIQNALTVNSKKQIRNNAFITYLSFINIARPAILQIQS
jgi:hypothetical protein